MVDFTSVNMSSSSGISPYLCFPPQARSVHFEVEVFRWRITVKATLRGVNVMLGEGWLQYQRSPPLDDVSTRVLGRAVLIVIPFHILESVLFPLPESLIIWHDVHELLDSTPVFEAWDMQSIVTFHQHVVIIHLHTLRSDRILDIFVLFTRGKQVVGIIHAGSFQGNPQCRVPMAQQ